MSEKTNENFVPKKEQFEFILTINGNIICQRYFRINGFKREAYASVELVEAIDRCVDMIGNDLKAKTAIYYELTAPQMFLNSEEMAAWGERHWGEAKEPVICLLRDTNDVYMWDGSKFTPYEKPFNVLDYVANDDNEQSYTLKLAFCDNGREVCSKIWDAGVYPRFVRTNIDISNSINKYKKEGVFAPVEKMVIDKFIESQTDLIPLIVKELCTVCSFNDVSNYTTSATYGDTDYDFSIRRMTNRHIKGWENATRKKTIEYFRGK